MYFFSGTFLQVLFVGAFPRYKNSEACDLGDEDEEDEGGPGWSAMASICKPSSSLGRREEKWGEENQWLNFRSFLGSFPF